jgi:hypothetical protein
VVDASAVLLVLFLALCLVLFLVLLFCLIGFLQMVSLDLWGALAWLDLGYVLWDAVCELSVVSAYADPFLCYSSNGTKTV